jgi:hypothetical protein
MKQERDFKGVWIPKEIWLNKDLTIMEKLFFVEINSLDNDSGCFAGNAHFADFFNLSKTRVSLIIKSLIDKGMITSLIIYKEGTKQILKRVLNICYRPSLTYVKEPIQQKLKDNNTIINTVNNTVNKKKGVSFKIPEVSDIKKYCLERKNSVDAESFFDFYESKGWLVGKTKMKDWKACIRTWERRSNKSTNDRTTSHKFNGDMNYGDGKF